MVNLRWMLIAPPFIPRYYNVIVGPIAAVSYFLSVDVCSRRIVWLCERTGFIT